MSTLPTVELGIRENWHQFTLLVIVNAFVGGMLGLERTVVPLLAETEFHITSKAVTLSFIASFGFIKALGNLFAGRLSDRVGRKRVLIAGWIAGLPVPFLVMFAPSWGWIVLANVLLGLNQSLAWSATVIMKMDLVGTRQRGLAMGLNEAAGYISVSVAALVSSYIASTIAPRPQPFLLGVLFAVAGLMLSFFFVRETQAHAEYEAEQEQRVIPATRQTKSWQVFFPKIPGHGTTFFAASQAGLINNLNDGVAWGLFPLFFAANGLSWQTIGLLTATYPAVWGILQLGTGAVSDSYGRKPLIAMGMWIQGSAILTIALSQSIWLWWVGAVLLGIGTALVYPTLLAAVSDISHPLQRASLIGTYRWWRDMGFVIGALSAGFLADALGMIWAIGIIGMLTLLSGFIVAILMDKSLL